MMINLRYALTKEDFFEFNYFHAWTDPLKKKTHLATYLKYWSRITLPTFVLVLIFNNGQLNMDAGRSYLIVALIGLVLALTTCQWAMKNQVQKLATAFAINPLNENFFKVKSYEITANGILVSDDLTVSDFRWEAIVRKAETGSAYYLFLNSHHALVIPKKNVEESQKQNLESTFKRNIPFLAEMPIGVEG